MGREFKVFLVVFITLYIGVVPVIHGCCPSCPTTNPQTPQQETPQLNTAQMAVINSPATQTRIQRLQNLSIAELNRETEPIVTFTTEQMEMVSSEYPEYFRKCKRVNYDSVGEFIGNRLHNNITCTPPLPRLRNKLVPMNINITDPCSPEARVKRSAASECPDNAIGVCTPVQSYVEAVFAHDDDGNLVQVVQNDLGDELQILIEERCLSEKSLYPGIISCCDRERTVSAVVVSLQGSNLGNIHVIDILVGCCTAIVITN